MNLNEMFPDVDLDECAEETAEALKDIAEKLERGEIECGALRVFYRDGSLEDLVFGGDEEDRVLAREELEKQCALQCPDLSHVLKCRH